MARVLLIEDDLLIQKTVHKKLTKVGFDVVCCQDGKEGMEQLDPSCQLPDIVVTDMMLPYYSGLEIVGAVKAIKDHEIPVIVLSSMGHEHIVEEAFRLGADDYITKPFNFSELIIRLKKQLNISLFTSETLT